MKTAKILVLLVGSVVGLLTTASAQPADAPEDAKPQPSEAPRAEKLKTPEPPLQQPALNITPEAGAAAGVASDKGLRLNFRGVPLEMVLNHLSEAAGFIIVLETEVRGKVDVWSNQPVSQEEALTILDSALSKNGYVALRNGRTLTIVSKDKAKTRDIPVKSGNNPPDIPRNDELVTQIIPVRYINATQLTQNLQPLLPSEATMSANEAGNALVITDTQASIRRITEIIRALDTSLASATSIRVFALRFADAKELANVVKELFPTQTTGGGGGLGAFFGGGGRGGGGGFGQGGGGGGNAGNVRATASRVVAVADEHSNSLVVNAPEDVMPTIEELVRSVDTNIQDVTELRVFRLRNADPVEMADMLAELFPADTGNASNQGQVQFGGGPFGRGGFFGGGRGGGNTTAATSERMKKQSRVIAVPDQRTSSVVVSAARELMGQIGEMIVQLDASSAKKQKVFVYPVENADVQSVEEILRGLFESQNSRNTQTRSSQNTNPLNNRNTANQGTSTGTGFGNNQGAGGGAGQQPR